MGAFFGDFSDFRGALPGDACGAGVLVGKEDVVVFLGFSTAADLMGLFAAGATGVALAATLVVTLAATGLMDFFKGISNSLRVSKLFNHKALALLVHEAR